MLYLQQDLVALYLNYVNQDLVINLNKMNININEKVCEENNLSVPKALALAAIQYSTPKDYEELINLPYSALMRKKINELAKYYEYQVIYRCFKADRDKIRFWANNKTFNNEHALVSYIMAIISANINDINKQYKKEQEDLKKLFEEPKNDIDLDILNSINETPKGKPKVDNDISDFLDD